jgi:cyclomaltodextrinase / maltogenic alpha-amylase / neopullulanase
MESNLFRLIVFVWTFWSAWIYSPFLGAEAVPKGAVIYGVVPPLFGYHPLKSVTGRMDELQDLGVDILWLTSIYESDDTSLISYAVTDHFKIREDFGSEKDLKDLVHAAKGRGMKVILDIVPNHTSSGHPYFKEALKFGKDSPFYPYYRWRKNGTHEYYFDWQNLPNLNLAHEPAAQMILKAFRYWAKKFNIDGYRVDVAWGPRRRHPEFWPRVREVLDETDKDFILLAEASARDPYYFQNGFDLAYDWSDRLGHWAWGSVFKNKSGMAQRLHDTLMKSAAAGDQVVRFINNNDTGKRFISRYGLRWTKVAAVLQMTLPGVPALFTGDEVGAKFDPYEDPEALTFEDPHRLRPFYRRLIQLREELQPLNSGTWQPLEMDRSGAVYGYMRTSSAEDQVIVILNFGPSIRIKTKVPEGLNLRLWQTRIVDAITGQTYSVPFRNAPTVRLKIPAQTALILMPQPMQAGSHHDDTSR